MSTFTDNFDIRYLPDEGKFLVLTEFEYHSVEKDSGLFCLVNEGFKTDLASIPWFARWLIPKLGRDAQGACCHDKVFQTGKLTVRIGSEEKDVPVTMGMANSLYYESMRVLKVNVFRQYAIRTGLTLGSWYTWNKYRSADTESITRH